MAISVPDAAELKLLNLLLAGSPSFTIKLFVNNITPADTDTAATYTEMSTLGYAAVALATNSATVATVNGMAEAVWGNASFAFTAGTQVTVYGYFVVNTADGALLWSEKFTDGKNVKNTGDSIVITPRFALSKAA